MNESSLSEELNVNFRFQSAQTCKKGIKITDKFLAIPINIGRCDGYVHSTCVHRAGAGRAGRLARRKWETG